MRSLLGGSNKPAKQSSSSAKQKPAATAPSGLPPAMEALSLGNVGGDSELAQLRAALAAAEAARVAAEAARTEEKARADRESAARAAAEATRAEEKARADRESAARAAAEAALAAENIPVHECLRDPGSRMFLQPTRPDWGDRFETGDGTIGTKTSAKWWVVKPDHVDAWTMPDFNAHLATADRVASADGHPLLPLIMSGQTTVDLAKRLKGLKTWEARVSNEGELEKAMMSIVWEALRMTMGHETDTMGSGDDTKRYPVSSHLDTNVVKARADTVVAIPIQYSSFFIEDNIIESRLRPLVGAQARLKDVFEDDVEDFAIDNNLATGTSRVIVELKRAQTCPLPMRRRGAEKVAINRALKAGLLEYMKSKEAFNPEFDPVSQAATYAVLTRTRYFIIVTGNAATYGRLELKNGEPFVYLSPKFKWAEKEEPGLNPWSPWEVLIRFVLAGMGTWYTAAFPDEFKIKYKAKIDAEVKASQEKAANTRRANQKLKQSKQDDDHAHDDHLDDDDDEEPDADGAAGQREPSRRKRSGGGGTQRRSSSVKFSGGSGGGAGDSAGGSDKAYALKRLYWEDLWAPLRFAVPATHPVEVECTWAHLEGDAELLGEGRMGPTYRQPLQGFDVVVKTLPYSCKRAELDDHRDVDPSYLRDEMRHEERVYQRLVKLQGKAVPRLLWYGAIVEGMADALCTEYAGVALSEMDEIPEAVARNALRALDAVHAAGVLHGDAELRNFVALGDDVRVVDFGMAKLREEFDDGDDAWLQAVKKERDAVLGAVGGLEVVSVVSAPMPSKSVDQPRMGVKRAYDAR